MAKIDTEDVKDEGRAYLEEAREYMETKARMAKEKAKEAGTKAHEYAKENPWGVAAVAGVIGLVAGMMLGRDKKNRD